MSGSRHPAHGAARRVDQRLGAHARDPERRGGRHRAPPAHSRRVRARAGSTSAGWTSATSCSPAGSASTPPWSSEWTSIPAQGALRRLVLQLRRGLDLHSPLSREPASRPGDRRRPHVEGVTVIVQNSDPFTYFRKRPIRVVEPAGLETGSLSVAVLKRATALELPTLIPRLLSGSAQSVHAPPPGRAPSRAGRPPGRGDRRPPLPRPGRRRLHRRVLRGGVRGHAAAGCWRWRRGLPPAPDCPPRRWCPTSPGTAPAWPGPGRCTSRCASAPDRHESGSGCACR